MSSFGQPEPTREQNLEQIARDAIDYGEGAIKLLAEVWRAHQKGAVPDELKERVERAIGNRA